MLKRLYVIVMCLTAVALSAVDALALFPTNYTADMETVSEGKTFNSKMYMKGSKQRFDSEADGQEVLFIMRGDKKLTWMVMPKEKMYMEMQLMDPKKNKIPKVADPNVKPELEYLGTETIDGHTTKKNHVTIIKEGGKKEPAGFIWLATDLGNLPIRYQTEDKKVTTTWRNIKTGAANDSQFDVPDGYKKMELPSLQGLLGGIGGGRSGVEDGKSGGAEGGEGGKSGGGWGGIKIPSIPGLR